VRGPPASRWSGRGRRRARRAPGPWRTPTATASPA